MLNIEKKSDKTPIFICIDGGSYVKGFHIAAKVLAKHPRHTKTGMYVFYNIDKLYTLLHY